MPELKTLKFNKVDIEPDEVEPILVELGGIAYQAHCPNEYEFISLVAHIKKLQEDPYIDIVPILAAFFSPSDVKAIDKNCRSSSGPNSINFVAELSPAMNALADHFKPAIEKRLNDVKEKISVPKAR